MVIAIVTNILMARSASPFSGAGASHQNGASDHTIKMLVTMARTMLMHAALRCTEDTLSTDLWPMEIDYDVWVYNWIPDMQYVLSAIEIWSRSRCEPVSETLSNFHFGLVQYMF